MLFPLYIECWGVLSDTSESQDFAHQQQLHFMLLVFLWFEIDLCVYLSAEFGAILHNNSSSQLFVQTNINYW